MEADERADVRRKTDEKAEERKVEREAKECAAVGRLQEVADAVVLQSDADALIEEAKSSKFPVKSLVMLSREYRIGSEAWSRVRQEMHNVVEDSCLAS